jgi:hypothetical protein
MILHVGHLVRQELISGAIEVTEATIALVRSRLIHPTRPELQVLASDQSRRRFEVSFHLRDEGLS